MYDPSMATNKQALGERGESLVVKRCSCPRCKRSRTLRRLPPNFRCADIVCDFCGFLAQVKTSSRKDIDTLPSRLPGAAWGPQKERMDAGIYFPLFIVLVASSRSYSIFYLSADLQPAKMFRPRKKLSADAKRAGWQGVEIDLSQIPPGAAVRLV